MAVGSLWQVISSNGWNHVQAGEGNGMILKPSEPRTETIARLSMGGGCVRVKFPEFCEEFRQLIKSLGFLWDWSGKVWYRKISNLAGEPSHRCAEVGRILIASGYCVEFADTAIQEMAINGSFEPECKRWIMAGGGRHDGWFKVWWGRGEDCYKAAKRITAARYSSPCIFVPSEHFEEVLDFASIHRFRLTEAALALVEQARTRQGDTLILDLAQSGKSPATGRPTLPEEPDKDIPDELKDEPL